MNQIFPLPPRELAVEDVYRDLTFPPSPTDRPYVLLNFVTTLDGQSTVGTSGAAGIGSAIDHRLMRRLRMTADALLHGAGTVRKDNFPPRIPADLEPERLMRGLRAQPFGAVVSRSGDLQPENRYFSRPGTVIFTADEQVAPLTARFGEKARTIGCGTGEVDLRRALRTLRTDFDVRVLLCEGGPRLAHDLIAQGLLDEIFLTLAPKIGSDGAALRLVEGPAFAPDQLPRATLLHVLQAENELFLRYRLPARPVPPAQEGPAA